MEILESHRKFILQKVSCFVESWRSLSYAPVIPAGIRSFLWNPVELFLAESPAKIAILGTIYSGGIEPFRNWDWNGPGMDRNRIQWNAGCIYDKSTMHTPSGMFLSHRGVHRVLRALKMTWQWVSWVHRPRIKSRDLAVIFITFEFQIYLHS